MNKILTSLSVVIMSLICFQIAESDDSYLISENGISGFIEIGMTLSELRNNGISVGDYDKEFFTLSGRKMHKVLSSSLEFELENDRVNRIWFFANKGRSFKIRLKNDSISKELDNLNASDILRNFGNVKKYYNAKPPNDIVEAYWDKNSYFGINTNTINYPALPFTFGLNNEDYLEYITVSNKK